MLNMLDVAIGLTLIFSLLALACSALREAFETLLKTRAIHLERGIRSLLNDEPGTGMAKQIFEHPLIFGLFTSKAYTPKPKLGSGMPSYIPAGNFSAALLDLVARGETGKPPRAGTLSFDDMRNVILTEIKDPTVQRALLSAFDRAGGDLDKAKANIEAWFDSGMDRVSGWFKRRTQIWLFVLGILTAIGLNVNTITVTKHLAADKATRDALVAMAPEVAKNTKPGEKELKGEIDKVAAAGLPIGWGNVEVKPGENRTQSCLLDLKVELEPPCAIWESYTVHILGWLITALAISLGAPFWFDLMNKLMVVRSTVKPHEKSPEESSEDRQKKSAETAASQAGNRWQGNAAPPPPAAAPPQPPLE